MTAAGGVLGVMDGTCHPFITLFLTVAPSVCAFTPAFFALICDLAVWGGEQNGTLAVFMYKTVFLIYNKV